VEVADDRHLHPASARKSTMSGTARAASSLLTVTRTICAAGAPERGDLPAVPSMSAVSVLVIDCTTTGWRCPPTGTPPTVTTLP
jgi:hypothetical protein